MPASADRQIGQSEEPGTVTDAVVHTRRRCRSETSVPERDEIVGVEIGQVGLLHGAGAVESCPQALTSSYS